MKTGESPCPPLLQNAVSPFLSLFIHSVTHNTLTAKNVESFFFNSHPYPTSTMILVLIEE